jgi:hypothetical protein
MDRVAALRRVEQLSLRRAQALHVQVQGAGSPPIVDVPAPGASTATVAWAGLTGPIGAATDWLVGSGLLAWTDDPARVLALDATAAAAPAAPPAPTAAGAAAPAGPSDAAAGGAEGGDASGSGGGAAAEDAAGGGAGGDSPDEGAVPDWRLDGVVPLLYHPAAVRSPVQKRVQVGANRVFSFVQVMREARLHPKRTALPPPRVHRSSS